MNTILTDDEAMRVAIRACDSLHITRVHQLGGTTRNIFDDPGLLEFFRSAEAAVLAKLRQQKLTREPVGTFKKQYWIPGSPGVVILHMEKEATMRDGDYVYAAPLPAVVQVPQITDAINSVRDAVIDYLDELKDDAIAHIWPNDLKKCQTSECVVKVASVRMGSPEEHTIPLFSLIQVREAFATMLAAASEAPAQEGKQ